MKRRSTRPGLPSPEEPEALAMPADQSVRLDDHQSIFPVEHPRPDDESVASRVRQPLRLHFVFLIKGQLLSQKQVLGYQRGARPNHRFQEVAEVGSDCECDRNDGSQTRHGDGILPNGSGNGNQK